MICLGGVRNPLSVSLLRIPLTLASNTVSHVRLVALPLFSSSVSLEASPGPARGRGLHHHESPRAMMHIDSRACCRAI